MVRRVGLILVVLALVGVADAGAFCYCCTWAGCADNGSSGYDYCIILGGECVYGNPCAVAGSGCPGPKCDPNYQGLVLPAGKPDQADAMRWAALAGATPSRQSTAILTPVRRTVLCTR